VKQKSTLFSGEPHWFDARQHFGRAITKPVENWLFEPGSLTRRIRGVCDNGFNVKLLKQVWQKPYLGESRKLTLAKHRYALVREVALCDGEKPLVYARTIIPAQTLRGAQRRLSNLGTRPLGEVLFGSPKLERNGFDLVAISPAEWRKCAPLQSEFPAEKVWGRRTVYSISGHELLVSEIFMPELFISSME
jgi:chorismate--pyruvate lyase